MATPSLLITGTGALASLFGARLAAAGVQVTMLGTWQEGLAALREHGVRLVEADPSGTVPSGSERAYPVRAVADPAECRSILHALVLVKSWQTGRAAKQLAACLPGDGLALTLQNGWGNRETLEQALGPRRVALGTTTLGATLLGPGVVRAGGQGPVILGSHPRIEPLANLLKAAGFDVRMADDVAGLAWGKLVINAAINPLTALLRVPNGALLERPEARELMGMAASEAAAVGRAQGLRLPFDDAVAAAEDVARRTAANHSSMYQDVQRGRPTEIDAICGAVVQAGERAGLATPVNRTLWLLVRAAGNRQSVAGYSTDHRSPITRTGTISMKVVTTLDDLRHARAALPGPVGLVPTMGYLHEGHLSLARRARAGCAAVAASIFVNPTQFGPTEDLASYPRDLARDLALLEAAGVDLVWTPTPEIVYPTGFQTWVTVEEVARPLEGARRPGHFRGVATVVAKLFNAFQPQRAYFGQKDAQQVAVIRQMARDLNFPVEIVVCPTVREHDGLAMSSRNAYLNTEQRAAAPVLFRALSAAAAAYAAGQRDAEALRQLMAGIIDAEPLAQQQYVSCADPATLQELDGPIERALLSMAVTIGKTRLIDNLVLGDA